MKHRCPKHGSSLHYHVCRHVKHACDSAAPMPTLGTQADSVICRDCLTDDVARLLGRLSPVGEHIFECHRQLEEKIGYSAMCTDCLFEKTGLDLRRRDSRGEKL